MNVAFLGIKEDQEENRKCKCNITLLNRFVTENHIVKIYLYSSEHRFCKLCREQQMWLKHDSITNIFKLPYAIF